MRGRKPQPSAQRRLNGNPGKRGYNVHEPVLVGDAPDCPAHLSDAAQSEWHRLAGALHGLGIVTIADRAALAAYCQSYGRWVEAEERLKETPLLFKTPSGYVQQSPWLSVANKQMELMARFMAELGITPASRSRIVSVLPETAPDLIVFKVVYEDAEGRQRDATGNAVEPDDGTIQLDPHL